MAEGRGGSGWNYRDGVLMTVDDSESIMVDAERLEERLMTGRGL